jgi:hypothetical protein
MGRDLCVDALLPVIVIFANGSFLIVNLLLGLRYSDVVFIIELCSIGGELISACSEMLEFVITIPLHQLSLIGESS